MTSNIENKISLLRRKAREYGLEVRFRNAGMDTGDFCIFIYDRSFRRSYAVGFDGDWDGTSGSGFDACLASAYRWMEKRDKRFTFRDGRWQYGHYHFIVWKDRKSRDLGYYLTIEEADRAAAEHIGRGCCVVCYDEPPAGPGTLAKVYGDYGRHASDHVIRSIVRWAFKNQQSKR